MNIQQGVLETISKLLPVNTSATKKLSQHIPTNHLKHALGLFFFNVEICLSMGALVYARSTLWSLFFNKHFCEGLRTTV